MTKPFPLLAEGPLQEYILRAIFQSLIDGQRIRTYSYSNRDTALAAVEAFLFERPRIGTSRSSSKPGAMTPKRFGKPMKTEVGGLCAHFQQVNGGMSHLPSPASRHGPLSTTTSGRSTRSSARIRA